MIKKRAPGGGRKSLYPDEKTVKVAITLLPSQVAAMERLGNGNLSAGIRKAIEMTKPTHLMTVDERALHEAVNNVKLAPQTIDEQREALRLQAVEYWQSTDDRPMSSGPSLHRPMRVGPEGE